jgi:protein SCO1/2
MPMKFPTAKIIRRMILGVGALAIIALFVVQKGGDDRQPLPVYGTVPEFSLTSEDGRTVNRNDLMGKVLVADFIFTRCGGTCPIMSARLVDVQTAMMDKDDVRLISFTVDPDYDTPEVLRQYAKRYNAVPGLWLFLTGGKRYIQDLSQKGFRLGVAAEGGSTAEPIIHSTKFVLVDRLARIRGYYDGTEELSVQQLIKDLGRLLKESS